MSDGQVFGLITLVIFGAYAAWKCFGSPAKPSDRQGGDGIGGSMS